MKTNKPVAYLRKDQLAQIKQRGSMVGDIRTESREDLVPVYTSPLSIEGNTSWKPIDTAPKDNKRSLYLARLDDKGGIVELDFDGAWEYWEESWELSHINGYCWVSANGIQDPTHWAYQDEVIPMTNNSESDEIAVFALYDDTGGPKFIKMDSDDGSLAIFDTEADAKMAKLRYPGTNYKRMSLCSKPKEYHDVSKLVEALELATNYLDRSDKECIQSGSQAHYEMREALSSYFKQGGEA